jgi:hypothetical protein
VPSKELSSDYVGEKSEDTEKELSLQEISSSNGSRQIRFIVMDR